MTIQLSTREAALQANFTSSPPQDGWGATLPGYCGRSESSVRTNLTNRAFSDLPTLQYYASGVYTPETCRQLVTRVTGNCGWTGSGLATRPDREFALLEDFAGCYGQSPDPYANIILSGYQRGILDAQGFTDLPADSSESTTNMLKRIGLLTSGGLLATGGTTPDYDDPDGKLGHITWLRSDGKIGHI